LAEDSQANPYREFDRRFNGLFVPASLFAMEPFGLGLSTERGRNQVKKGFSVKIPYNRFSYSGVAQIGA